MFQSTVDRHLETSVTWYCIKLNYLFLHTVVLDVEESSKTETLLRRIVEYTSEIKY